MTSYLFRGGTVATSVGVERPGPEPEVLAVSDGVVVALGDRDPQSWADEEGATVVDLEGGCLAPAFGDGHCHPPQGGLESLGPQIRDRTTVAEVVAAVGEYAAAHPDVEWVVGASYDSTLAPEGLFDARWLDEVVPDRPVMLRAWDYHTVWVNTEALRRAGIDDSTPDPELGRIVRRADGSAMGTLQEFGAVALVLAVCPPPDPAQRLAAIDIATRTYAAAGVTWVQDAWVESSDVEAYLRAAAADLLHCRVNLALRADPARVEEQLEEYARLRDRVRATGHPRLTAETVKLFVDGVVENHTAHMLAAYTDRPGDRGLANWTDEQLREAVTAYDALGFQCHLHAIGDAACRSALDAFEHAARVNGPRDRRPVLAHLQVLDAADVDRIAELGVVANFEPLWAHVDPAMEQLHFPRLGAERSDRQYAIGEVLRTGAHVSFGSDWPVTTYEPLPGLATAVTRRGTDSGGYADWTPEQRITAGEALTAYTHGVAYQAFADADRGHLSPGAVADLVWLSADPRAVDPDAIGDLSVRGTWLAGEPTFGPVP